MPLQIRLVHALADEVVELQPRSVEQPLVVGRSAQAEVQVPSANAALRHCLLFVHGGNWVIQDAGSPGGTLVNGKPITVPVRLNSGDVITLAGEANPPVLVVDPNNLGMPTESSEGAGTSGGAVARPATPAIFAAPALSPAAHARPQFPVDPSGGAIEPGAYGSATGISPPYIAAADGIAANAGDDADEAGVEETPADETLEAPSAFEAAAPTAADLVTATAVARKVAPRKSGLSVMTIVVTGMVALAMIIGCIVIVHQRQEANHAAELQEEADPAKATADAAAPTETVDTTPTKGHPHTIFNLPPKPHQPAPTHAPAEVVTPSPAAPAATAPVDEADDPRRQTPEWIRVENATVDPSPVQALVVFDDYLKETPDSPFKSDVDKYIDDALDRLWCGRIVELCKQRTQARKDIESLTAQIRDETDPSFKKTLVNSKQDAQKKIDDANSELKDFKYTGSEAPNLDSPGVLKALHDARDPVDYAKWKKMAYHRIVSSHGLKLPW